MDLSRLRAALNQGKSKGDVDLSASFKQSALAITQSVFMFSFEGVTDGSLRGSLDSSRLLNWVKRKLINKATLYVLD